MAAVTLIYHLEDSAGGAQVGFQSGKRTFVCMAGWYTNVLKDLADAMIALLEGAETVAGKWENEPHVYKWRMNITIEGELAIRVDESYMVGKKMFTATGNVVELAVSLRDQIQRVLDEHGPDGYEKLWVEHKFPMAEFTKLTRLLEEARQPFLSPGEGFSE